ncbi:cupredoxin domain-containing protein [Candidatus Woesearchaeota archaeon]|nr:cupredoxin domain-containing protein [Candidatus Woesearchaeota archaeon]
MGKIMLFAAFAALSIFLLVACSQQNPEDLVGQGTPVNEADEANSQSPELPSPPQEPSSQEPIVNQAPAGDSGDEEIIASDNVKEFRMTAKQFSFEPGTIEINKGDKVRLIVTSIDVPHGISIPEYGINERLDPGTPKTIEFTADKEGTFTAFCSVFCGSGHSNMKGKLIVR